LEVGEKTISLDDTETSDENTETPDDTETPDENTETPDDTETPDENTETPDDTETPDENTETPDDTEEQDQTEAYKRDINNLIKRAGEFIRKPLDLKDLSRQRDFGHFIEREFKKFCNKPPSLGIDVSLTKKTPDIPEYNTDIKSSKNDPPSHGAKLTDIKEKFYGLKYNLLVFNYKINGDNLVFSRVMFIPKEITGDHRATFRILDFYKQLQYTEPDDLKECLEDLTNENVLPELDISEINRIVDDILRDPPKYFGYLTLSGGQWEIGYNEFMNFVPNWIDDGYLEKMGIRIIKKEEEENKQNEKKNNQQDHSSPKESSTEEMMYENENNQ